MAVPDRYRKTPPLEDIERALRHLCTNALRTEWILDEKGGLPLLGLACVRDQIKPGADKKDDTVYSQALRKYLKGAVERIKPNHPYRVVIEVVMGVGDEEWENKTWRKKSAKLRRTRAGEVVRPEAEDIKPDTIRQNYEPPACTELALIVWNEEREVRGEKAD